MSLLVENRTLFFWPVSAATQLKRSLFSSNTLMKLSQAQNQFSYHSFKYTQRFQLSLASENDCALQDQERTPPGAALSSFDSTCACALPGLSAGPSKQPEIDYCYMTFCETTNSSQPQKRNGALLFGICGNTEFLR